MRGRALQEGRGVSVGAGMDRILRGRDAHHHRLVELPGQQQVMGEVHRYPVRARRQHLGHTRVQLLAARYDHVLVHSLASQRVPELVSAVMGAVLLEQLEGDAVLEGGKHRRLIDSCHVRKRGEVEGTAQHRGGRQDGDRFAGEAFQPMQDRVANRAGDAHLAQRFAIPPVGRLEDVSPVQSVPQHLLHHERVALAALEEKIPELVADLRLFEDRADDVGDIHRLQRLQLDQVNLARATPAFDRGQQCMFPVHLVGAIGG